MYKCGLISSVRKFCKFIVMELDHTLKRQIVPDDFFYMCANLQKKLC
jgi:hypothetical protein